jgi:GTP-binding protein HflX
VTDTVGFIRKLPHHLVASFRSTLEEAREADVLLNVVDASHPDRDEQEEVVREVLETLGLGEPEQILVYNKVDRLTHGEEEALRVQVETLRGTTVYFVSALDARTLEPLRTALRSRSIRRFRRVRVDLPVSDGETLAAIYRDGEVISRRDGDSVVEITARLPDALLGRLRQRAGIQILDVA